MPPETATTSGLPPSGWDSKKRRSASAITCSLLLIGRIDVTCVNTWRGLFGKLSGLGPHRREGVMRRNGFSIIELLVAVLIIGIIAAIAMGNYLNALNRAKQKRTMAD